LDFDLDLESDELEVKLLMEELKELFPFFNVCGVIGREYALALVSVVDRAGIISSSFSLVEDKDFSCSDDALDGDSTLTWTSSLIEFREEFLLLDLLELLDFLLELELFLLDLLLDLVGVDDLTSRAGSIFSALINS